MAAPRCESKSASPAAYRMAGSGKIPLELGNKGADSGLFAMKTPLNCGMRAARGKVLSGWPGREPGGGAWQTRPTGRGEGALLLPCAWDGAPRPRPTLPRTRFQAESKDLHLISVDCLVWVLPISSRNKYFRLCNVNEHLFSLAFEGATCPFLPEWGRGEDPASLPSKL